MKYINFLGIGILFGLVMTKSEAISWFRIQEMFMFHSFHMYGIIGMAVVSGAGIHLLLKRSRSKNFEGDAIVFQEKPKTYKASLLGGTIFGLGWALTGACPGPLYVLFGHGYLIVGLTIVSAILGALCYGYFRSKLPH